VEATKIALEVRFERHPAPSEVVIERDDLDPETFHQRRREVPGAVGDDCDVSHAQAPPRFPASYPSGWTGPERRFTPSQAGYLVQRVVEQLAADAVTRQK